MLALMLRIGAIGWALCAVGVGWHRGSAVAGLLAWLALPLGAGGVLALQFSLLPWLNRASAPAVLPGPRVPPPTLAQLGRAWWGEWRCALRLFMGRLAWRSDCVPSAPVLPPVGVPPRRPVLLVHGFACNHALWREWIDTLSARGHAVQAVDLEPVFGSIDAYAATLDAAVRQLHRLTGLTPVLVGHSMGGLAIRAWLRRSRGVADAVAAHHVITLGTPHHGTVLARSHWAPYPVNAAQMRPDSPWLADLQGTETDALRHGFTCFYSRCDNIVTPANTACLAGADNRHVDGVAHIALVFDARVVAQVLEVLDAQK